MDPRKGLVLAKIETTYGTDPVPTAALNAIQAQLDVNVAVDGKKITREFLRDSESQLASLVGRKLVDVSFKTEIKASGTAGTAPRHGPLHRACGMSEVIVAVTSVTYALTSAAFESCTIYAYMDGILHKITGAYGNLKITEDAGQNGIFEWAFKGLFNLPIDAATAAGAVFDATNPKMIESLALTVGGYTPIAKRIEFDLGRRIGERSDFNSAEGFKGLLISGRAPGGSFDPEAVTEATHPFWSNWKNATEMVLAGNMVGSVAGNKVAITAPKLQYEAPQWAAREVIRNYNERFQLNGSSATADDEISIAYT